MARYIKSFQNAEAIQEAVNNEELLKPYVAYNESAATIDYNTKNVVDYRLEPLTFKVANNGNITWKTTSLWGDESFTNPKTILYSINNGEWVSLTSSKEGVSFSVNTGDIVKFKGDNKRYCTGPDEAVEGEMLCNGFSTSCQFEVCGNIMSLVNSNNFSNLTTVNSRAFLRLFWNCTGLTDASKLVLPATTLAEGCYQYMFISCSNLVNVPELPATTLAAACYQQMFQSCTSLIAAPELPATTLARSCYASMFQSCSNLNYIKCLATDISASKCTKYWVSGVASTGTFVKDASMTSWTTGIDGIPSGWTVQEV